MKKKMDQMIALFLVLLVILLPVAFADDAAGPSVSLFVDVQLPEYHNSANIDISGKTLPGADIDMYVNDVGPRILAADSAGDFSFDNVQLTEGENKIRFDAKLQGNVLQKEYVVMVDTLLPVVELINFPEFLGEPIIVVNGSVNEEVNISFEVTIAQDDGSAPPKVTGLKNTSIEPNKVELSWDKVEIEDFGKYVVYRNGKAIASTPIGNEDYTDFSDIMVNSGSTYSYEVLAIDVNRNLGEKSDALTATTSEGGSIEIPDVSEIDIYEDMIVVKRAISTEDNFLEELILDQGDGFYKIVIEAVDKAGNKLVEEREILLDTKEPNIEIISPRSSAQIYENFADEVTIKGKTDPPEPGARIYLYVERTPLGMFETNFDISGVPDEFQDLPESELRVNCELGMIGTDECATRSDYKAIADANGYFEFKDIDLTSMWAGAFSVREYETGEPYRTIPERRDLKDFMRSELTFVAVDAGGKKGIKDVSYEIVSCWNTDLTWRASPMIEYQYPSLLSVERLREGTETINFALNMNYYGMAEDGEVINVHVASACGNSYLENLPGYNYSCRILGSCSSSLSRNGKMAYVTCPLRRLDGLGNWSVTDWESFVDAVRNEMRFPFKVKFDYNEYYDNNSVGRGEQVLCTETGYVVDAVVIPPGEVLPDWLLYDFVDILNESLDKINTLTEKTREVLQYAFFGCMATYVVKIVTSVYRRTVCELERVTKQVESGIAGVATPVVVDQIDPCGICLQENRGNENPEVLKRYESKPRKDFQDLVSDKCLKVCYPSCASGWEAEASLYQAFRWTCDRVFGHETPSKWTQELSDDQIYQKLTQGSSCSDDQSVRGRRLRAVKCKSLEEKYRIRGTFGYEDMCLETTTYDGYEMDYALYHIDRKHSQGENVYEVSKKAGDENVKVSYVIKQDEDNYLAPLVQSCEQVCKGEITGKQPDLRLRTETGQPVGRVGDVKSRDLAGEDGTMLYGCITPNECVSYMTKPEIDGKNVEIDKAVTMGYTSDCFFPEYVSGDPGRRIECCCVNPKTTGDIKEYYRPTDVEGRNGEFGNTQYGEMKWSYRYDKINYPAESGATRYNPNRYIKERDFAACFGQNNWIYDPSVKPGQVGNLLIIDPMKQHVAAFQCVAITQILSRFQLLSFILGSMQRCLLSIRNTGFADTGVCKETFTQYVCSFVWRVISYLRGGCLPFGSGIDFTKSDNDALSTLSAGMKGLWDSVGDSQNEIASEYGNAELNNLLGMGEQDTFRKVCLGAFGYDWEINFNSLLDVTYDTPFATFVQPFSQRREFLGFDPTTGKSKYEYRASWMINPGCDLDGYEVYLGCVNRDDVRMNGDIDCSKQRDPWGTNCACLGLQGTNAPREVLYYQSRGNIKQNEGIEVDSTMIPDKVKMSDYRYDHLVFKFRLDRDYIRHGGDPTSCFTQDNPDGVFYFPLTDVTVREVAGCNVDVPSGTFSCREGANLFYEQGFAEIEGVELDGYGDFDDDKLDRDKHVGATYYANEPINGKVKYSKDEELQCLAVRIYDAQNNPFFGGDRGQTWVYPLRNEGGNLVQDFSTYMIKPSDVLVNEGAVRHIPDEYNPQGNPGLVRIKTKDKAAKVDGTYSIRFYKMSGITNYEVKGGNVEVEDEDGNLLAFSGELRYDLVFYLGGFAVRFRPDVDDQGTTYRFETIEGTSSTTESGSNQWVLHIDIRSPKEDGSCSAVRDFDYDNSQIVVSNGIKQERNIPILVNPNTRNVDGQCKTEDAHNPITEECICGGGSRKNCPNLGYDYCYEKCRKYPKCEPDKLNTGPCVCGRFDDANKYNCAYDISKDSDFGGDFRDGSYGYCVANRCTNSQGTQGTTPKPEIIRGSSLIQTYDESEDRVTDTPLSSGILKVKSKFRVSLKVDGKGRSVDSVELIRAGDVPIHFDPPPTRSYGFWSAEIDLSYGGVKAHVLSFVARSGGEQSTALRQDIMVIGNE
ncbi:MAG: hypothetical protein U9O94_11805 [Nanoarchaeota archaeon]|nr:hypothetical protein [Nanoarchaeota archaeon]